MISALYASQRSAIGYGLVNQWYTKGFAQKIVDQAKKIKELKTDLEALSAERVKLVAQKNRYDKIAKIAAVTLSLVSVATAVGAFFLGPIALAVGGALNLVALGTSVTCRVKEFKVAQQIQDVDKKIEALRNQLASLGVAPSKTAA